MNLRLLLLLPAACFLTGCVVTGVTFSYSPDGVTEYGGGITFQPDRSGKGVVPAKPKRIERKPAK